ncbi:MAG: BadF/BadG/BcrA/BcrD ATPase family protein [Bryobacteraceae bacterium]|nr:BadF/BadG/BcrA/BcrD ATPase family protein [Bryobacteraceae bacterium]
MPQYFLGVDGGQSSTTALIGDETGRVLGFGRGGPCNHVSAAEARAKFTLTIGGCVAQAREAGGLPEDIEFRTACYGFSGGPVDKDALVAEMFRAGKRLVTHDAYIALCGAHAGGPGVITIAGTGSISFGRGAEGRLMRAGGWGYVFGDEGGGFDLTRQALRAALRVDEGWGPPTLLRDALVKATDAKDANDLMHRFYGGKLTRPQMAALSRLVDKAALAGDVVADGILTEAAQQLAGLTLAVRKKTFAEKECAPVAYIGGVFHSARLLQRFRTQLERDGLATVAAPKYGPAAGALLEAYRMAGLSLQLSGLPAAEK